MSKVVKSIFAVTIATMMLVGTASASIATDMDNFSQIIGNTSSGFTGLLYNMMSVFLQPPLLYFVVLGIFVTIISITAGLLVRRGRRR